MRKVRSKDRIPKHIQEKVAKRMAAGSSTDAKVKEKEDAEVAAASVFKPVAADQ